MVYLLRLCYLMVFSFIVLNGKAQLFNSYKIKIFKSNLDTLFIDSLSILPGSLTYTIYPSSDSSSQAKINYQSHSLILKSNKIDSILVKYICFPYNFEKIYFHKNQNLLFTDFTRKNNPFTINYKNSVNSSFIQNDGLYKNGSISRGISFGNNQDVVVNSNLNLQVSGKLTPEIDLVIAATDNNIPFQANGTTAQLQEFDKVFIQLSNQNSKLIAGDYQLSRPVNSYFMNFYKRAQGIYFENKITDSSAKYKLIFKTQASAAVSRGKFSRQVFFGVENNQGPYRLQGANNEPFIIILSGTEKIYIDGKLLLRGQENEYIIDYNSGELTFTAKQLITKDKRIVAEFQYAERNFARSLFFFGEEIQSKKSTLFFNVFSEQDDKNSALQQTLNQNQKNILINIGDSLNQAFYSGIDTSETFNGNNVFYKKQDSLINGINYKNIFVYSVNPVNAKYNLKFSNVGRGNGNYNQINSTANGKVYEWIAPINGEKKGTFEPIIPLISPKLNQMITTGYSYTHTPNNHLYIEGVYTKNDINTFSSKDKQNDEGTGLKIDCKNQSILHVDSSLNQTKLIYNLNYEFIQKEFKQVERFRTIEFDRDWNRPLNNNIQNNQQIISLETGIIKSKKYDLLYGLNLFDEGSNYLGIKQNLIESYKNKNFNHSYTGSFLKTKNNFINQNTEFYRHKTLISYKINKLKIGINDIFENNIFYKSITNNLTPNTYQFWEWEASLSNADSTLNKIKLFYKERQDKQAYGDFLKDSTIASNIGIQTSISTIKNNPFSILISYRKLNLSKNIIGTNLKSDVNLLNRFEYNPRLFNNQITSGIFYETGYGLENTKEYYYLEVPAGQGLYCWRDYNKNEIKELNEFEISQFADQAKFIRIYTPTNKYVKVIQNQLSVSINIRPKLKIITSLNRFINLWGFQTILKYDTKLTDNTELYNFNPFAIIKDSFLITANNNLRQSIFFNQSSAIFGADYTYIDNKSKQLLYNGIEVKSIISQEIKYRINFLNSWALNGNNSFIKKESNTQFFSNKNYLIESLESEQKLNYQPTTNFRMSCIYKYIEKINTFIEYGELNLDFQKAFINSLGFELKYTQTEKGSLSAKINLIKIRYSGAENTPLAYEMLNGLNIGENYTWDLNYQRNINTNIQININYIARKNINLVHLGGVQIKAFF